MSDIIIDPAQVPNGDRFRFNLLADDIGAEFDNLMYRVSVRLTDRGQVCGYRRTTYKDLRRPIILELTMTEHEVVYGSTELLLTCDNAYSYSFYAAGGWRACTDCKQHYIVAGATNAGFDSSYRKVVKDEIGPGKIASCLKSLSFDNPTQWPYAFRYICYVFIESVRLIEFGQFVRLTLVNGKQKDMMHSHVEPTPVNLVRQPNYWGQASSALCGFFLSLPARTRWLNSTDLLNTFSSTAAFKAESSFAARAENLEERERLKILAEVNFVQSRLRIVMHP